MIPTNGVFCTNFKNTGIPWKTKWNLKNPSLPLNDHLLVKSDLLLFTCYTKEIVSIPLDAQSN